LVAVLTAAVTAASSAAPATPQKLYTRLLTSSYPDSQLPDGFSSAKVGLMQPSDRARKYHVVGEVEVGVDGPDVGDAIVYYVFPAAADARGDLAHPSLSGDFRVIGKVPGYSVPSVMAAGSVTGNNAFGKKVTNGITGLFVLRGNVIVGAVTASGDHTDSGNVPAALALLRSALKHLQAVTA
jgi:hypothetical protein